jgi:nucleotide-binding universal stress UspA family protein
VTQQAAVTPKVVVAWDGSPAAATAFSIAEAVARQLGARVEAVYVLRGEDDREQAHRQEEDARRFGASLRLLIDDAATQIIRVSEEPGVRLVTLTTHGREIESGYRLGSVAERVVARAMQPVLIVQPESSAVIGAAGIERLLVPIDGTPKTAAALQPVTELACDLGAAIDMLYVAASGQKPAEERGSMTPPRYLDQPQHDWPQWAAEAINRLARLCASCPESVPVRIFVAEGEVGDEISRFARENGTDAIVLVRRSRFQPDRAKVIRSVLSQTACSVIIVGGEET